MIFDLIHYCQNSEKLISTRFVQKYTISDALDEVTKKYHNGELDDKDQHYTVRWMKHLNLEQ
jgi:hypothetical protein